jgi:hypothetical protein
MPTTTSAAIAIVSEPTSVHCAPSVEACAATASPERSSRHPVRRGSERARGADARASGGETALKGKTFAARHEHERLRGIRSERLRRAGSERTADHHAGFRPGVDVLHRRDPRDDRDIALNG